MLIIVEVPKKLLLFLHKNFILKFLAKKHQERNLLLPMDYFLHISRNLWRWRKIKQKKSESVTLFLLQSNLYESIFYVCILWKITARIWALHKTQSFDTSITIHLFSTKEKLDNRNNIIFIIKSESNLIDERFSKVHYQSRSVMHMRNKGRLHNDERKVRASRISARFSCNSRW